jgi:hypothetical protein
VLVVLVVAGAFAVWYIFFRPAGPPPIGPGAPIIPPGAVSTPRPSSAPAPTLSVTVGPASP